MNSKNNSLTPENDFDKLSNKFNKNKLNVSFNRIAFIFFSFVLVLLVFSLKAFYLTGKDLPVITLSTNQQVPKIPKLTQKKEYFKYQQDYKQEHQLLNCPLRAPPILG